MSERFAIVGCGKQKLALEGDKGPVAIARLYTSTYFELKRAFAKTCCDRYHILSAKYGLVEPGFLVEESYDVTIQDLSGDELDKWTEDVTRGFRAIGKHLPDATLVILAGQAYYGPIVSVLEELPNPVECPFTETSGIGEQMGWLKAEIEAAEQVEQTGDRAQPALDSFEGGGRDV